VTRVLVVDDDFREQGFFREVFDNAVTVLRTPTDVVAGVQAGSRWDIAFIDFDLGETDRSGLSAWISLRPVTRWCISYTRAAEAGRILYNLATRHWFGADAVLDKSLAEPATLYSFVEQLSRGTDPSQATVPRYLRHAPLIGQILPDPQSVLLWRKWNELGGNEPAIQRQLGVTPYVTRHFKETVSGPVETLLREVFQRPSSEGVGTNSKFAGPLSNFAGENRKFFNAGDLDRAVIARVGGFAQ
jgi:hypothetical protein